MSDFARRTEIEVYFQGINISADARADLLSMTYMDGEGEEQGADDLQLTLQDSAGDWLYWLNTPAQPGEADAERVGPMTKTAGGKGAEIHAAIIQENFNYAGRRCVLDCGIFEVDSVDASGPPAKVNIKGTSIPYTSTIRTQKKSKAWENIKLSGIAGEIATKGGMKCLYESKHDPYYKRKEQMQQTDIEFLQKLCTDAGISLKSTARTIVLFDATEYEKKPAVRTIARGSSDILKYKFSTNFKDCAYTSCKVSYTDPKTGKKISATYKPPNAEKGGNEQVLEINEKVTSKAEAMELAEKRLREKNGGEYKASFTLVGDTNLVAGVTVQVSGWSAFDGKYIIKSATHKVTGGYTVDVDLQKTLEGY